MNLRDVYIMLHLSAFGIAITTYMFMHPDSAVFATGCAALTTILGMYHWFTIKEG